MASSLLTGSGLLLVVSEQVLVSSSPQYVIPSNVLEIVPHFLFLSLFWGVAAGRVNVENIRLPEDFTRAKINPVPR